MTETEEATIDPKDITYDIILNDDTERPDRGGPEAAGGPAEEKGDHPAIAILDMAIKQSEGFLKEQGLPPANNAVYESFSKPFLNEALWHYRPEGTLPDDPRFALVMGVAGLGLAFSPTLIALYQKKEEEEKREKEKEKRRKQRREEQENGDGAEERREDPIPGPVAEPPDWMTRLESGMLGGM